MEDVSLKVVADEEQKAQSKPEAIPNVILSPEQIEEIHVDEYSLALFHATRLQPMSLLEIKRQFPEPKAKKAQSVMERYVTVGLVHVDKDGRFYSNFPRNYVNLGKYKYDADIEAKKDRKVFQEMKDNFGNKQHWEDRAYFSIDSFFSEEQTSELRELFMKIREKSKQFANDNAEKGTLKGLKFRRLKFYDVISSFALVLLLAMLIPHESFARGNDPHKISFRVEQIKGGSGNDPSAWDSECLSVESAAILARLAAHNGGSGHDPKLYAKPDINGGSGHDPSSLAPGLANYGDVSCKAEALVPFVKQCEGNISEFCKDVRSQAKTLWQKIQGVWDI